MTETDFGKIISELRSKNRLSQKELVKEIGVHVATIKNRECNRCTPDAKNIGAIKHKFSKLGSDSSFSHCTIVRG